jgi:AraC family transcriptional regulator
MAEHRLERLPEKKLAGKRLQMSFARNKTQMLWQSFMPHRKELQPVNANLYSVEIYPTPDFFTRFDPEKEFEKWAAMEVSDFDNIPEEMGTLVIPEGLYAVFHHKGPASEGLRTYQYIFGTWFPQSEFTLDHRPHFALMDERYKHEAADSEEEIWIPVRANRERG